MNSNTMSNTNSAPKDEIFVIGIDGTFRECLINFTGIENAFHINEFENSFQAFHWLEEEIATGGNSFPKAIICEFGFLEEEKFLLLHNLQSHPTLRYIPCIAMNRDGLNHKLTALKLGFDDYYDVPVHWSVLKERIGFLTEFKKEVLNCELEPKERLGIALPLLKRALDIAISPFALIVNNQLLFLFAILLKLETQCRIQKKQWTLLISKKKY